MSQGVNLQTKSLTELKAFAYDLSAAIQQYQQMLQVTNQEIGNRIQQEQQDKEVISSEQKPKSQLKVVEKRPEAVEAETEN